MGYQKTIVVGLDFSNSSKAALKEAKRLRERSQGRLVVTHVIDERLWHDLADDFQMSHDEVIREGENQLQKEIGEPSEHIESAVVVGHPVNAILETCADHEADLLVLGAQGSREEARQPAGLGNVAGRLLRHAPCDVLLLRNTQDHPFRKITASVDFSESSDRVVERAIEFADQDRAELTLVHVMPFLEEPSDFRSPLEALGFYAVELKAPGQGGLIEKANRDLQALVGRHHRRIPHAEIETHLEANNDARIGLRDHASKSGTELLVVGKLGHSRLKDIMLGSTAERIANVADCSVLAVS